MKIAKCKLKIGVVLGLVGAKAAAAQFVDLTAEIQTVRWVNGYNEKPARVEVANWTTHCVVGTNAWLIEQQSGECTRDAWWFTGSNVVTRTVVLKYQSDRPELFARNHPELVLGRAYVTTTDFYHDGRVPPGEAITAGDQWNSAFVNLPWLAFCSGWYLKGGGRVAPPSMGYQATLYDNVSDTTIPYQDPLGLPSSVEIYRTNQPVCQYRTVGSTNFLGWTFPLEFHLVQYRTNFQTHVWEVHLTASGKLTAIGVGREPVLVEERRTAWK